ncbi:MAG: class II aldolase/adducin family protein [Pseudomonadota bacterium]
MITKEDFSIYCRFLYDRRLVTGVGGNLSIRAGNKILITPSGYSLRDVTTERIVTINKKGKTLDRIIPTKDWKMHVGILEERPEINAVCHVHGPSVIALSVLLEPGHNALPPITPGFVFFSYPLPMIPFMVPGSDAFTEAVVKQFINTKCTALLLQNHGLVTVGGNFYEALNIAEEIDEAATIYLLTKEKVRTLSESDIESIKSYKI